MPQTDLDWINPVVLFTLAISGYDSLGITYDASNNSLWVSKWDGTAITDYSMIGTVLSSFSAGFGEIGGLALDHAEDTLWATSFGSSTLYQFDKAGNSCRAEPSRASEPPCGVASSGRSPTLPLRRNRAPW